MDTLAMQFGGWAVALGPLLVASVHERWSRKPRPTVGESLRALWLPAVCVAGIGLFLFSGELCDRNGGEATTEVEGAALGAHHEAPVCGPYLDAVHRHTPLNHHHLAISCLYAVALLGVLGAAVQLVSVQRAFRASRHDPDRTLSQYVSDFARLRGQARKVVLTVGCLIGLAIVATGALRTVINDQRAAIGLGEGPQQAHPGVPCGDGDCDGAVADARSPAKPLSGAPVVLYGAVLTLFLAGVYWPVHSAAQDAAQRVITGLRKDDPCTLENVKAWSEKQAVLEQMLGTKGSVAGTLQSAVGVLAPVLASISALAFSMK